MTGARRLFAVAVAVAAAAALIGTTSIAATAAPAGHATTNRCANSTKYLFADSATDHHGVITIRGQSGYIFCDRHSEYIKLRKATITFKTTKTAPIRVLDRPYLDPSRTHRIRHSKFPAYVSHPHGHEQYYTWTGPRDAITKIRAAFQS